VSVATVQPSNAVEFGIDVAVNEPQDGLSAQSAIEADEPTFDRAPEPLPTGDFSDSFPVLIDDPDDTASMPPIGNATIGVKHSPITQIRGRSYHGGTLNNKSLETRTGWRVFRGQTYFGRAIDSTPTVVNHYHFSPSVSVRWFE